MNIISLQSLFCAAIFVIVFIAAGRAEEKGTAAFSKPEFQSKLEYCKTCHGLSGQGYRGYYPMPRLAGQRPKYIENQLRAFIERRRMNPVMFNVAHALSPSMVAALTTYFQDLNPNPLGGAPKDHLALGKTIFEQGLPESNVPACSACHGPDAKGQNESADYAQLDPITDCRHCRLRQLSEVNSALLQGFDECTRREKFGHETHQVKNSDAGNFSFCCRSVVGR
jgi:cytochrome c553